MPWRSKSAEPAYLQFAERCLTNGNLFKTFKKNPAWMRPVGVGCHFHSANCGTFATGVPAVLANFPKFALNDTLGSPMTVNFSYRIGEQVTTSPFGLDTLRFVESVAYLYKTFGNLSGLRITEYGANYGALAYMVLTQWPDVQSYHAIDLPQIQTFSRMYLSKLGFEHPALKFEEPTEQPDIFISELALTEQDEMYELYERYCRNAQGFLIRSNLFDFKKEHLFFETLKETFTIEVTPEGPSRHPNKLVMGKRK